MYFSKPVTFIFASCLAATCVIAAPTQEVKRDPVYPGYCTPDPDHTPGPMYSGSCTWTAQDGSGRMGVATCDPNNYCGVNDGVCYYDAGGNGGAICTVG